MEEPNGTSGIGDTPIPLVLIPVTPASPEAEAQAWAKVDQLAAEIQARWPEGVPAAEAVAEGRE